MVQVRRQLAMVLDLNKCLGCQTCTIACKKLWTASEGSRHMYWNNVETQPGDGYPRDWENTGGRAADGSVRRGRIPDMDHDYGRAWTFNHDRAMFPVERLERGGKPWLQPAGAPTWGPNWDEDRGAGKYPSDNHYWYLPRLCNHCTHPACKDACPRGAIEKRAADGIVVVNQDRCHGYRFCVEACPYKKMFFDHERGVASKCIFCFPRIEQGVAPACARQCPGRLRFVGYLDDPAGPIHKLVVHYKVALPLHPEFGTQPNVFYVPPLSPEAFDADGTPAGFERIPLAELEALFGPAVGPVLAMLRNERAKVKAGGTSDVLDLLIAYDWQQNFRFDLSPVDGQ